MSDHPSIPIQPVAIKALARPWGEEIFVAETPQYLGKLLHYRAGAAGGLQYHVDKDETFYLHSGTAYVDYDGGHGTLVRVTMEPGESFHIPPGAVHRFVAITDCVVFEASTAHYDDRVRVEDRYGVPHLGAEFGLPTTR